MINRKFVLMTTLTFAIFGCSSYHQPESIKAKMARFMPRDINPNRVPSLATPTNMESQRRSREIASVPSERKRNKKMEKNSQTDVQMNEIPLSDKRLYFMSLYQQYQNFGKFVSQEQVPEIDHCPSFHTTLLNGKMGYRGKEKAKLNFAKRYSYISNKQNKDTNAYFPELSLPMNPDSETPTLGQILNYDKKIDRNIAFQQALKVHLTKTYKELEELCNSGSSSNYYNFANLEQYIKHNKKKYQQGPQALTTLYKTTIFSNMALIKSLENPIAKVKKHQRTPASVSTAQKWDNIYQDHMIKKLNVSWTKRYLKKTMTDR